MIIYTELKLEYFQVVLSSFTRLIQGAVENSFRWSSTRGSNQTLDEGSSI